MFPCSPVPSSSFFPLLLQLPKALTTYLYAPFPFPSFPSLSCLTFSLTQRTTHPHLPSLLLLCYDLVIEMKARGLEDEMDGMDRWIDGWMERVLKEGMTEEEEEGE